MRNCGIIVISLLILSCSGKIKAIQEKDYSKYLVKKITSKGEWHILYLKKNDTTYKVISKKALLKSSNCKKVKKGNYYTFNLKSNRENAPEINGVKIQPMNYLDIQCFGYGEGTYICIEPNKGIYDLYHTDDLSGLCYLK